MRIREDLDRFRTVGEQRRQDLSEFIKHGDLADSDPDRVKIPVKVVDLPEFAYDVREAGGIGQAGEDGPPQPGTPIDAPGSDGGGEENGEPGEETGEHGHYEMDPEEFAAELDEELGLDLVPKGKQVIEEVEGDFTDVARKGPDSTLDLDELFKRGLKRKLATDFDESYVREGLRVEDADVDDVFQWARETRIPVSRAWIADAAADVPPSERGRWESFEDLESNVDREPTLQRIRRDGVQGIPLRSEDERYRYPEVIEKKEKNVVVVNIRDVSGSMRESKRELVERVFTPLDWYLTGKYDAAEFRYVAHDVEAWEVERGEFFGLQSGGGTRISSAYEVAAEILEDYPFSEWNRYVFAAGDSENSANDTRASVIPMMESIDANLHAYVETQPSGGNASATHADEVADAFADADDVAVAHVASSDDVVEAIYEILSTESQRAGTQEPAP